MTIYDIFKEAIKLGIENDFRTPEEVQNFMWRETVTNGSGDSFINPFPDSGIVWVSDIDAPVMTAVVGVDLGQSEIVTIREWEKEANKKVDLFIGHHSEGRPATSFAYILKTQLGNLKSQGVLVDKLDSFFDDRVTELYVETLSENFNRVRDAAALLKCDYLSLHSPIDNLSARFVERTLTEARPKTLADTLEVLLTIPEYAKLDTQNQIRPTIVVGSMTDSLGKFLLTEFVGGEEGPLEIYNAMHQAGVNTVISMHMSPEALTRLRQQKVNVIAAGHIGSDSIGLNLFTDTLVTKGIEVIPLGGFIRCSRL
ncbi:MAG TPA: hypothetical protein VJI74_02475 [Candidatus Paceibacterota bacterium]